MDWNMWSAIGACGSAIASLWALCYARKALNTWNRQEQFKALTLGDAANLLI